MTAAPEVPPSTRLEPWRKRIRGLFAPDAKGFSDMVRQKAIDETVERVWGIDKPGADGKDTNAHYARAQSAAAMFVCAQSSLLMPELKKPDAQPDLLDLLNHTRGGRPADQVRA